MFMRKATAVWEGGARGGKGNIKSESGTINAAYSYGSRFENGLGASPEELLAAAEAISFVMTLCAHLEKAGTPATRLEAHAACSLDKRSDNCWISSIKLIVRCSVPNLDPLAFQRHAQEARDNCPISLALKGGVRVELDCKLV
jgi:osmotically inducible protein OsmC